MPFGTDNVFPIQTFLTSQFSNEFIPKILVAQFIWFTDLDLRNWPRTLKLCPIEISQLKFLNEDNPIEAGQFDQK